MVRLSLPVLTVALALAVTACGGGGATKPLAASVSATPTPPVDQDAAAKAVVKAYVAATDALAKDVNVRTLADVATTTWAATMVDRYQKSMADQGKTVLGHGKVMSMSSNVAGDAATVAACVDGTGVFVVPKGTTAVDPAKAQAGDRLRDTFHLVLQGAHWLVNGVDSKGEQC